MCTKVGVTARCPNPNTLFSSLSLLSMPRCQPPLTCLPSPVSLPTSTADDLHRRLGPPCLSSLQSTSRQYTPVSLGASTRQIWSSLARSKLATDVHPFGHLYCALLLSTLFSLSDSTLLLPSLVSVVRGFSRVTRCSG